jgi:hypothetical protein
MTPLKTEKSPRTYPVEGWLFILIEDGELRECEHFFEKTPGMEYARDAMLRVAVRESNGIDDISAYFPSLVDGDVAADLEMLTVELAETCLAVAHFVPVTLALPAPVLAAAIRAARLVPPEED